MLEWNYLYEFRISQRIYPIFEILELYPFAFTALAIDKTFTQRNFLSSKIEIVSMYFLINIYKQMKPRICENLRTANFNPKFTGYEKQRN